MSITAIPCKPKDYGVFKYSVKQSGKYEGVAIVKLEPDQKWSFATTRGMVHVWRGSTHLYLSEPDFIENFTSDDLGYKHIEDYLFT